MAAPMGLHPFILHPWRILDVCNEAAQGCWLWCHYQPQPWDKSLIKGRKPQGGTERGWIHTATSQSHPRAHRWAGSPLPWIFLATATHQQMFTIYKSRPVNTNEEKGGSNSYTLPRPICDLTHLELFSEVQGDTWKSLKVIFLCSNLQAARRNEDITQHCRINSYCGNHWFDVKAN